MPVLTMIMETFTLKNTARTLLHTYLGEKTGERVLMGKVRRGDGEVIPSVIWFSDLRGSTQLADKLPLPEYLDLLNEYYECVAGSVLDHDGEVLKFIGDGVLAIFPLDTARDEAGACINAITAAREAMRRIDELNVSRRAQGKPPVDFGIGLHPGDIMYGNIGTQERLEFGITGAAANEAARVEGQCKVFEKCLIVSDRVVRNLEGDWQSLGSIDLRGISRPVELFAEPE